MSTIAVYLPKFLEEELRATDSLNSRRLRVLIQTGLAAERGGVDNHFAQRAFVVRAEDAARAAEAAFNELRAELAKVPKPPQNT